MKTIIAGLSLVALVSCANPGVESKVYAAEQSLTLAEQTYVKTCRDVPALSIIFSQAYFQTSAPISFPYSGRVCSIPTIRFTYASALGAPQV